MGLHEFKRKFGGDYVEFLGEWDYVINQLWIILFNILAVCSAFKFIKLKFEKEHVLMCLILLVYFGVYLLIEVMPRYAYSLQVFEAIIIGISLDYIFTKIKALKKGK